MVTCASCYRRAAASVALSLACVQPSRGAIVVGSQCRSDVARGRHACVLSFNLHGNTAHYQRIGHFNRRGYCICADFSIRRYIILHRSPSPRHIGHACVRRAHDRCVQTLDKWIVRAAFCPIPTPGAAAAAARGPPVRHRVDFRMTVVSSYSPTVAAKAASVT